MQPSRAGAWKPRNGTNEQVSGKPGTGPASRSQAAVLCPPCINSHPLQRCVTHAPSYLSLYPFPAQGPRKVVPGKTNYLLFSTSFTVLVLGIQPEFLQRGSRSQAGKAGPSYPACSCARQRSSPRPCCRSQPCSAPPCHRRVPSLAPPCHRRVPSLRLHRLCPQRHSPGLSGGLHKITAGTALITHVRVERIFRVRKKEAVCFSHSSAQLQAQ